MTTAATLRQRGYRGSDGKIAKVVQDLLSPPPKPGSAALSTRDQTVFRAGGFDTSDDGGEAVRQAMSRTVSACKALVESSIGIDEFAARLHCQAGVVQQLIDERALYAIHVGARWLLPAFQFDDRGVPLPGLKDVLAAIPDDMHALTVEGFFTTPDPDLADDDTPLAPAAWLSRGGDAVCVVELASSL